MTELRARGYRGCGKTFAAEAIVAQALRNGQTVAFACGSARECDRLRSRLHGVGTGTLIMVTPCANVRGMKGPNGRPDVCVADDLIHATASLQEIGRIGDWWRHAWTNINPEALYFTFGDCP